MSRDVDRSSVGLSLAERLGRRGFMAKLAAGAMGLAGAIAGLPQTAQAATNAIHNVGCCHLCNSPVSLGGCTGRCCWTWACCVVGRHLTYCKECYTASSCGPTCPSRCSGYGLSPLIC